MNPSSPGKNSWAPWLPPFAAGAYLIFAWTISYLVDFHAVDLPIGFFWPDAYRDTSMGYLWAEFFAEGSPTEVFQWGLLATAALFSLCCVGFARNTSERLGWLLMAFGTAWMFMEDRIDVRHVTSAWLGEQLLGYDPATVEWRRSLERSLIEIGIYSLMGMVMLGALWFLWRFSSRAGRTHWLLVVGYASYAVAATASATRNLGDWYASVGNWLFERIASTGSVEHSFDGFMFLSDPAGFWFMDYVIEESIELVGAASLAGWTISMLLHYAAKRPAARTTPSSPGSSRSN